MDRSGARTRWGKLQISPPAWGWTVAGGEFLQHLPDFPTRVGMDRMALMVCRSGKRFPHPRGDGPLLCADSTRLWRISPPAWGWTDAESRLLREIGDFPTRVGMDRVRGVIMWANGRFPHPRGDGPCGYEWEVRDYEISPPAWGWTAGSRMMASIRFDFPTRVGMDRYSNRIKITADCKFYHQCKIPLNQP